MLIDQVREWGEVEFTAPATKKQLAGAESALSHPLPDELRQVLSESNGLVGEYGLGLVWDIERIVADNLMFRSNSDFAALYMSFDSMTFFADGGNGDQFAIPTVGNQSDVFVWNHEDDSRMWVAPSVIEYLKRWMSGALTI
ncbi:MAG: hypothetical protein QOJ72_2942 [Nocardioidaceae bacterium]|jgi:cell wall assembly regulator SMI1|nr:hypothetical protein [Nocardioidaceae bacterium]